MPFQMKFAQEKLEGFQPFASGVYKVRFITFKPKTAKPKPGKPSSINFNAEVVVMGPPEWGKERTAIANLNSQIENFIQDFVHSFGLEMQVNPDKTASIPGAWEGEESKPETWKYIGPLTGKIAEWEFGPPNDGQRFNTIRKFICKVPNCAQRFPKISHASDMAKNS